MVASIVRAERATFLAPDTDLARYIHQLRKDQSVVLFLTPDDQGLVLSGIDNCFYDPDGEANLLVAHMRAGQLRIYRSHSRELSNSILPRLNNVRGRPMEELLWIAGFTGYTEERCCLDAGCRRDDVIRLNYWPNFTRLPTTPNSFKLASLFSSRPTSIVLASRILDVPEHEVMQFYNAACYSGIATRLNRPAEPVEPRAHRQQGLIRNLFNHLVGNRFGKRTPALAVVSSNTSTKTANSTNKTAASGCCAPGKSCS